MSRDHLPAIVGVISARLRELLAEARTLKPNTSIEPALSTSDFATDVREIAATSEVNNESVATLESSTSINQSALEEAARKILYEKIATHDVKDPEFVDVWNLLDLLQICAHQEQCDAGLALWLVEEMLDSQTIDGCRYILEYLKSRRTQLIGKELTRNKSNTILRTCNELLRRLSRAEDAVFCGDVFVFLFQVFPLGDKSAVNLRGEFHVENITTFDPEPEADKQVDGQNAQMDATDVMQVDEKDHRDEQESGQDTKKEAQNKVDKAPPKSDTGTSTPARSTSDQSKDKKKDERPKDDIPDSRTLYPSFWSLQHIFSNPTKSFDTEALAGFKKGLELTFSKFKATPKIPRAGGQSRKRKRNGDDNDFASTFNPKYLTSRDLFDLELSDLTFQRHILVQALILLDFLMSLTPEAKKRTEALKAQKSMIHNYTLGEQDAKWCRSMRTTISDYLQEPPDGKLYYRMVDNVLSRDKNWVAWKIESCQDISRPPVSLDDYIASEDSIKRLCTPRRIRPQVMGALNTDFLDSQDLGLDMLRNSTRMQPPSAEAIVKEVQSIDLDLEMVDKETQPEEWARLVSQRASKTWRCMRLERGMRFSRFAKIDETKDFEKIIEPEEPPSLPPLSTAAAGEPQLVPETEEQRATAVGAEVAENGDGETPHAAAPIPTLIEADEPSQAGEAAKSIDLEPANGVEERPAESIVID